MTSTI